MSRWVDGAEHASDQHMHASDQHKHASDQHKHHPIQRHAPNTQLLADPRELRRRRDLHTQLANLYHRTRLLALLPAFLRLASAQEGSTVTQNGSSTVSRARERPSAGYSTMKSHPCRIARDGGGDERTTGRRIPPPTTLYRVPIDDTAPPTTSHTARRKQQRTCPPQRWQSSSTHRRRRPSCPSSWAPY